MIYTVRQICMALAVMLGTLIGHLHGDEGYLSSCAINENSCFSAPVSCDPQLSCCDSTCCRTGFLSLDFLYLKPYQGGLAVCGPSKSLDIINPNGTINSFFRGKRNDPHFKWSPGFRVGAGYQFTNNWGVAAYWMYFYSKADRHDGHNNHFRWKLNFDVVDVVIENEFYFGSCFTVRPFVGVRGARIEQKARGFNINTSTLVTTNAEHKKARFTGIGGIAGLELNWNIGCGWGIYANSAISSLWGKHRVRFEGFSAFPAGDNISRLRDHLDACELVFDSAIGLSWTKCFRKNNQFWIRIGLEQHRYFDHNRIGNYGDLCLGGGFLSAGLEF